MPRFKLASRKSWRLAPDTSRIADLIRRLVKVPTSRLLLLESDQHPGLIAIADGRGEDDVEIGDGAILFSPLAFVEGVQLADLQRALKEPA